MLRQRLMAALLGLPMLFILLWLNWTLRAQGSPDDFPLLLIVLILAGASGWEVSRIIRQRHPHASAWNGLYAALILPFMVHAIRLAHTAAGPVPVGSLALLIDSLGVTAMVMLLFLGVWSDIEIRGREGMRENLVAVGAGLYLGTSTSTLLLLGQTPAGEVTVMFIFLTVFALDTAAYFGGKHFQGPRLAPMISPSKTVSGAICGLLGAITLALLFKVLPPLFGGSASGWWNLGASLSWAQLVSLGAAVGIIGQVGDLAESALKRWGGVKDSGAVFPGHGGFLDRFDSLFLAAPICLLLLVKFLHLSIK
jgi:phosphatidate cytidylyltransferase